ncbi:sortase [Microbacterium sp. P06]|uniref:sortase n=1 Tax=unclassified Microbacterium TaxID=2609290 RepID=UPI003746B16E
MTITEAPPHRAPEPAFEPPESVPRSAAPPRTPRPPKAPRPPRRPPRPPVVRPPLSRGGAIARSVAATVAVLLAMFVLNLTVFSHVQHLVTQQKLSDEFRAQLSAGTAPVSEGTFEDVLLADGVPVGILEIPRIGMYEVIVEGTSSAETSMGIAHRRDSVLPGQAGVSVIMGRSAAYGGPFSAITSLSPGDTITVRTGQGMQIFEVMGLRYAGDATPPAPVRGESRMILMTARGAPYIPGGISYVDAKLVSETQPSGARQTTSLTLPPEAKPLATDTTTVWALVFALQFLIAVEIAAVWAFRRFGAQKTWIVFLPVLVLAGFLVADQTTRLLPNLL